MKKLRVGINGLGRIGRAIYRINDLRDEFDVVLINDINPDINNLAYLLQYDSTYGRLGKCVAAVDSALTVDGSTIAVTHEHSIADVPWSEHGVDVVIDSSGIKANVTAMPETSGVKHIVITNSPEGVPDYATVIFGVNDQDLDLAKHKVISSSICDTIATCPVIKIVEGLCGIESGFLLTIHPWLSYQNLVDGPSASWSQPGDIFSHYALGRASPGNIIPKSTSAIRAAEKVFPGLSQRIESFSYRTPTHIVSGASLVLVARCDVEQAQIVEACAEYERQNPKVLHNSMEPLTSVDYLREEYSVIVDHRWTKVMNRRLIKLVYWYDNEWGYSSKVVDLLRKISDYYSEGASA